MPAPAELSRLLAADFKGSEKDYSTYLDVLSALGCRPAAAILDYGCSWGYGSWQLARAGYRVAGLEISKTRRTYASEQLGVQMCDESSAASGQFDIFFTSHVLEHVPSILEVTRFARRALKPGGWFIAFTPNGSAAFRDADPKSWNHLWGQVHPNFLDEQFYAQLFDGVPNLLASSPYSDRHIPDWVSGGCGSVKLPLSGPELLVLARFA